MSSSSATTTPAVAATAAEADLGKAQDLRLLRRLWPYIAPYRRDFLLSVLCLPLISACSLVQPLLLKFAIDAAVAGAPPSELGGLAALYLLAILAELLFLYGQHYWTMVVAQKSLADLRRDLFNHVHRLEAAYFDRQPVGRLVTRLTTDVDVISEMFAAGGLTILMDVLTLLGIIGIMLAIDVRLTLVSLALLPLLLLAINFFRVQARQSYRRIRERIARVNAYLQEAISGITVIQLFAREKASLQRFADLNDAHRRANHSANLYEAALFSLVEAISSMSFGLILWNAGGRILQGSLGFGTLVAFIEYVQKFFVPVRDFSAKYAVVQSAMTAAERVFELLDTVPGIVPPEPGRVPRPRPGRIEFRNVWFAYRGEDWVLRDLSFTVEPGEKVAVVGATGAGKTTIGKLLTRQYEVNRGAVLVDGVNVRHWHLPSLRRHIGSVAQDVFLFSGTVEENIRLQGADIPTERVRQAAATVHADSFIEQLPHGYAETLRERGSNLSTGQRQLLSFARALAHDPPVLVLDEATSSIDTETERLVQDGLERLLTGRTAIVIAHRLSTIEGSDRILVLNRGELVEQGSHRELVARSGLYARLHALQNVA